MLTLSNFVSMKTNFHELGWLKLTITLHSVSPDSDRRRWLWKHAKRFCKVLFLILVRCWQGGQVLRRLSVIRVSLLPVCSNIDRSLFHRICCRFNCIVGTGSQANSFVLRCYSLFVFPIQRWPLIDRDFMLFWQDTLYIRIFVAAGCWDNLSLQLSFSYKLQLSLLLIHFPMNLR